MRATTAQLYPGQDTFEFSQRHMTKNQPITVLILLSESLAILLLLLWNACKSKAPFTIWLAL